MRRLIWPVIAAVGESHVVVRPKRAGSIVSSSNRAATCGHTALHVGGRSRNVVVHIRSAQVAAMCRAGVDSAVRDLCAAEIGGCQMSRSAVNGLAASKAASRHGAYGARIVCVAVAVEVMKIVNGHAIHVVEMGVVDVDVMPISRAAVVPRVEWLTPTQWEPANACTDSKT